MSDDMEQEAPVKRRLAMPRAGGMGRVLGIVLLLLAAWLGWTGWRAQRSQSATERVTAARDHAAERLSALAGKAGKDVQAALATPAVAGALAAGDLATAAAQLKVALPKADSVEIWPLDMAAAYAALPKGGYGRLAAAEKALASNAPTMRVAKDGTVGLYAAVPAVVNGANVGVALVRWPVNELLSVVRTADVGSAAYLALRRGDSTLVETGDVALKDQAESLSTQVSGTVMRVVAAAPDKSDGVFGLGALPTLAAAAIAAILGLLALLGLPKRRRAVPAPEEAPADPIAPASVAGGLAAPVAGHAVGAMPAPVGIPAGLPPPDISPLVLDPGIFRAYDIRGVVGDQLTPRVAEAIGQAVGSVMEDNGLEDIVIGRDGRHSGPELVAGLIAGLRRAGRNVIDIGMVPTPVVYFGTYFLQTGCGIAVTGSHNPPDYNGFKIMVGGQTLSGPAIRNLHERIVDRDLHVSDVLGTRTPRDISEDYIQRIAADIQLERPLKVVVDAGNGAAGNIGPRVLQAIGADVLCLYCDVDGSFPNHHPDPSEPHNLEDLIAVVAREEADLGVAFDGDGDRMGAVTREGRNIFPDRLLMLFAADVLSRDPGAQILYDVKCSGHLPGWIERHGGRPLMWKTGHSLIKAKMRETNAALAGEMSGHFFFGERWYGFDDGIYAAARLLQILANREASPSLILDALPDAVCTPEIKVPVADGDPHGFVERFRGAANFGDSATVSTIDGVRADWSDGWGLLRASNTTPVLVLRFEAADVAALERIMADFRSRMLIVDPALTPGF